MQNGAELSEHKGSFPEPAVERSKVTADLRFSKRELRRGDAHPVPQVRAGGWEATQCTADPQTHH